jgi:flagellum-specific ATP synthase
MTVIAPVRAEQFSRALAAARPERVGVVSSIVGLGVEVSGLRSAIGDLVTLGEEPGIDAEVVATTRDGIRCMPLGRLHGINVGTPVHSTGTPHLVPTGRGLFGRVLDGLGRPIDGKGPLVVDEMVSTTMTAPRPCTAPASSRRSSWACAFSTPSPRSAKASAWASSPGPASGSPPCSP